MLLSEGVTNFAILFNWKGEASRQVNEYRFKYQKAEQELQTLEGHVSRN